MDTAHIEQPAVAWRALRTLRRSLLIGLGLLALLVGGYWFWLRDSGLVAVRHITISGVSGPQGPAIRSALRSAASDMTTLHVRVGDLRAAVGPFPLVADLRVRTDFPHGMAIRVVPHVPVAAVVVDGRRIAIAADGTLLRGAQAAADLPVVPVAVPPGGTRLTDARALAKVALLAAAPVALRTRVVRVSSRADGLHAKLRSGPDIVFGTSARLRAKWVAAARVLADDRSHGAAYVDVRIPEQPVAGRFYDSPAPTTTQPAPASVAPQTTPSAPQAAPSVPQTTE